jgi:paraquat-inducible protein B
MTIGRGAYLRVGALLLFGVVAIIGLVVFLTGEDVRNGFPCETYFKESVQGLNVGAAVKYRGVPLGQVTEMGLVSGSYMADAPVNIDAPTFRMVFVRFVLDASKVRRGLDLQTAIQRGLRVRLASQGITGLSYLELDFVDPVRFPAEAVPWQPKETYIPSMLSTIAQVQDAAQLLLAKLETVDLQRLAASVQQVLDDVHAQLTSGDAAQTLTAAKLLLATVQGAVQQADLPGAVHDFRATAGAIQALAQGKQTKDLLATSTRAVQDFSNVAKQLGPLVATLAATVRQVESGAADIQSELAPALRDAKAAAGNLRETSETLRRYPASVLFGGPPPRPETGH